jgi:hypothetical protein
MTFDYCGFHWETELSVGQHVCLLEPTHPGADHLCACGEKLVPAIRTEHQMRSFTAWASSVPDRFVVTAECSCGLKLGPGRTMVTARDLGEEAAVVFSVHRRFSNG